MRGRYKLRELQETETHQPATGATTLYAEKIELICARYVYYNTFGIDGKKPSIETTLSTLSREFFISTGRIADIITRNTEKVASIRKEKPEKKWYQQRWIHIVW